MTPERRKELKEQCGNEPNLRATLATLEGELAPKLADVDALIHKRDALVSALAVIDGIKAQLAAPEQLPCDDSKEAVVVEQPIENAEPAPLEDTGESPSLSGDSQTHDEGNLP
jgi:hypothetical protein